MKSGIGDGMLEVVVLVTDILVAIWCQGISNHNDGHHSTPDKTKLAKIVIGIGVKQTSHLSQR